jgi:hypothetical protein
MFRGAEDVARQGDELFGPDNEPSFLKRLSLRTRKIALSHLKMAAGELPLACAVSVNEHFSRIQSTQRKR